MEGSTDMNALAQQTEEFARCGATWTVREIAQQPATWRSTEERLRTAGPTLSAFLAPLLAKRDLRIILTGAGSSAYIGRCLAPELLAGLDRRVEAIATTDLVAGPRLYLQRETPTLLVSFARSGSSPESTAAAALADECVSDCHQLVITCNREGELYRSRAGRARSFVLLMPEESHDRGFAMTSSFSAMLHAAQRAFQPQSLSGVEEIGRAAGWVIEQHSRAIRALAAEPFRRVVYLGSRGLAGLADEAALKLLELTDGEVVAVANSPLGFRHGPKTFVNRETLVVVFVSNDPLARRYDLDLLRELVVEGHAGRVLALSSTRGDLDGIPAVVVPSMESATDIGLCFPFVVFAQLYALFRSLALGGTPDNPSRSGAVNRVVKGVTIHESQAAH
jgi:tagatose-6-phosphate ketose/aldose isomerase